MWHHNHQISVIEYLWDEVETAIRQPDPQIPNLTQLDSDINQAWRQIPRIIFQYLVDESPHY